MDYLGGSHTIARVLTTGRQEGQSEKRCDAEERLERGREA